MTSLEGRTVELARQLLARLDKEIARGEAGTVAVGGITKAGVALEDLLREVINTLGQGGVAVRGGIGDLCASIRAHREPSTGDHLVDEIVREVRKPASRLGRLAALRNQNAHGGRGRQIVLSDARETMRQVADWLRRVLATGGKPAT